jgi:hypothetical protein
MNETRTFLEPNAHSFSSLSRRSLNISSYPSSFAHRPYRSVNHQAPSAMLALSCFVLPLSRNGDLTCILGKSRKGMSSSADPGDVGLSLG